jgi:predicted nucleotidyltransferase
MITKEAVLVYLRSIKPSHEKEGIVIHGIFGSFARDEASENSDIDVLIETTPRFVEDTDPLRAFSILQALREEISHQCVDLADKTGLRGRSSEHILKKTIYA